MTVKRVEKIAWAHNGPPVMPSDRKVMLTVLRRARRESRRKEHPIEKARNSP